MHIALALTGLLLFAKAIDDASSDSPHFGWSMSGMALLIAAAGVP